MTIVLDPSVVAKWFLNDEASREADDILRRVAEGEDAVAPEIFRCEIENLLLTAERAGRIGRDDVDAALEALRALPIQLRLPATTFQPGPEVQIARAYGLSAYDAAYLSCADELGVELVTAGKPLAYAARALDIPTKLVT